MKPKFEFVSWLSRGLVVLFPGAIHHVLDLKWYLYFMTWFADKHGMPELPAVVPTAEETFASMDFSDVWSEASMVSVCHYLRKGTDLNVPPSFRNLLPKKL